MADNVTLNAGAGGDTLAADDIGGVKWQWVKPAFGAADSATAVSASDGLPVAVVAALPAGSAAIGKLAANSGVDIGDVDVTSVPADPFGANADAAATAGGTGSIQAKLRLITSQLDSIKTAVETLDNIVGGSEAQVDIVGSLPAGTNNIGDVDVLSLPAIPAGNNNIGDVDIASIAAGDNNIGNVDIVTLPATPAGTNAIGKLLPPDIDVTGHTNYIRQYYTNAGAVTDGIVWSPASGKRWHVVALYFQTSAAATITFEDDKAGGDAAVLKGEYAANSGAFLVFPEKYPMASGEDAADLLVTTSAGNIYVMAVGYEI